MNSAFKAVVDFYKPVVKLTHKQQVMRTYRKALRLCNSWAENRDVFNEQATLIRQEFNKYYNASEAETIRLLREATEQLSEQHHPDPYIHPVMPGGTSFMRNPAIPLSVVYPDGIPSWESKRRLNIDMSNIPDDQQFANKVFVDSMNKQYWIDK